MRTATVTSNFPPEFLELSKATILPDLISPQAIRLNYHIGISTWGKARACDSCGKVGFTLHDAAGHYWRQAFQCHQRFCITCAVTRASKMIEKYSYKLSDYFTDHPDVHTLRFMRVVRKFDRELTKEDVAEFTDASVRGAKAIHRDAMCHVHLRPFLHTLECRILIPGEQDIRVIVAAFPSCTVRATSCGQSGARAYLHELFGPDLPRSPIERADCEHFADRTKLFRSTGAFYGDQHAEPEPAVPESAELFTQVEEATVNNLDNPPRNRFSRCPCCGSYATHVSETYSLRAPLPRNEHLRFKLAN